MNIRPYQPSDFDHVAQLFYDTVHTINRADYTQAQRDAWAHDDAREKMRHSLEHSHAFIVEDAGTILGFANITDEGYIDLLFVHKDAQAKGIGSKLIAQLEAKARSLFLDEMNTNASITARPFFEKKGFTVISKQTIERNGVSLDNYRMVKILD